MLIGWKEFMELGDKAADPKALKNQVKGRIARMRPGNCCNIVYTSGTTGMPKAAMLSHDNMLYNTSLMHQALSKEANWQNDGSERIVSYLPLSHSAAQNSDLLMPMLGHAVMTFAKPDALQGSLVDTLKETRPTLFFAVPRVWEKFEEKLREFGA